MKKRLPALLACSALVLSACAAPQAESHPGFSAGDFSTVTQLTLPAPSAVPALDETANAELTAFGVELLRQTRSDGGQGALVSPLSAALALSMAANGAAEETLAAFEAVLGAGLSALNSNAAQLMADYAALGGSTRAGVANSLWADENTVFYDQFLEGCAGYDPGVFTAALNTDEARQAVNQWVNDQTQGMIPEVLKEVPEKAAALLVSAVWLQNAWTAPFEPRSTRPDTFHCAGGTDVSIDFMHQVERLPYFSAEGVSGALLPCDDGRLAFAVLLPDGGLDEFLDGLDGEALSTLLAGAQPAQVFLSLPRFTAQWSGELSASLRRMGLDCAFDPGQADFSNMGEQGGVEFYISKVLQSVCLEVNEAGSTAAAATVVEMDPSSAPSIPLELNLNRPFLYAVWDTQAKIPLFLGTFEGT